MTIAFLDTAHESISTTFTNKGWTCHFLHQSSLEELLKTIHEYDGIIIRSRIKLDADFLSHCKNLKFIGRPGAGLENIDLDYCAQHNIQVFRSPEGNCDAVGEHALGMLLMLLNNLKRADLEVRNGIWKREDNRGFELKGKTIAIIGYGYMGMAFAKKLKGFEVNVIAYDKYKHNFSDEFAREVSIQEVFNHADILSLHTPQTQETKRMINASFINNFQKSIYFINTARGKSVVTKDLLHAITTGKIKGACLDVLEFEQASFENISSENETLKELLKSERVILSPHIAGWTFEAELKMGMYLAEKITASF